MRRIRLISPLLIVFAAVTLFADSPDQRTFESAARDYRIHIYETYRTQREEYNRRFEEAEQAASSWHKLEDLSQQQELISWFVEARSNGNPSSIPSFVNDEQLVIRIPERQTPTQQLVSSGTRQTTTQSTTSYRPSTIPRPAVKEDHSESKPGFFSALTRALISKPSRNENDGSVPVDTPATTGPTPSVVGSDGDASDEDAFVGAMPLDQLDDANVPAEVSSETSFDASFSQPTSDDDEMALTGDIMRYNVDCDATRSLLEDEAALDMAAFLFGVEQLEKLKVQFDSIQTRFVALPENRKADFPETKSLESLVHVATERALSPQTWMGAKALSAEDQATLSSLEGRLSSLLHST